MRIHAASMFGPLALAVVCASCEDAERRPAIAVDSAGVRIVVSDPLASDATCALGEEPLLVVGDRLDDPAHLFGRVVGATRLSDGSVAVVDPTVDEVRLFDKTGEHVRSFGRFGDGPGEFKNAWLAWVRPGDTLWIGDYQPWRYNVFSADGVWSRAVELEPIYLNPSFGGGVLSSGTLIASRHAGEQSLETPDTLIVEAHDPDGKLIGVLARLPNQRMGPIRDSSWEELWVFPVFEGHATVSARGDRIAMGASRVAEVRVLDSEYKMVAIVRWNAGDRSVNDSDIDAYREEYRVREAWRSEPSRTSGPMLSPNRPVADVFPAFSDLLMGNAGHLFVVPYARPSQPTPATMVFAPTGEFMCHLPPTPGYTLWEAGADYLLGVHLDEMDTATVVVYRFGPPQTMPMR